MPYRSFARLAALKYLIRPFLPLCLLFIPESAWAALAESKWLDLTDHRTGYYSVALFCLAYLLVMGEEFTNLRKSKPVILAAGAIWGMIGYQYGSHGLTQAAEEAFRHNLLDFAANRSPATTTIRSRRFATRSKTIRATRRASGRRSPTPDKDR